MKKLLLILVSMLMSFWLIGQTITIGTGTNTQRFPFGVLYGYERSASLYTAAEIGITGNITTLGWYIGTAATTNVPSKIYLKTTTSSTMTASTWASMITGATLVYDATRQYTPSGWLTIDITDFNYSSDNLLVLCESNYGGGGTSSSHVFRYSSSSSRHQTWATDNTPPSGNGSVGSSRPNIQITIATAPCSGTPDPGNTISSTSSACSGVNFTLSLQNTTPGSGVTYQWQSSLTGAEPWTNMGTSATQVTSQTEAKYYRCEVTCDGNTGTSNSLSVTMNSFLNCYCSSSATSTADEDIFNVTLGSLNNTSTCASTGGPGSILNMYSNYSTTVPATDLVIGSSSNPFSVQIGTCGTGSYGNKTSIFIDFNQDGDFGDVGESVYAGSGGSGAHIETGNIIVPANALLGNTMMRVVTVETAGSVLACGTYSWGETEDYLVNIIEATNPLLSVDPFSLNFGSVVNGNTSSEFSYLLTGSNLSPSSGDITITPPANFEVSVTSGGSYSANPIILPYTGGVLNSTIYVVFKPSQFNTVYSGNISNIGGGASNVNVAVTGSSPCDVYSSLTQTFDAVTIPALPACWSKVSTYASASIVTSTTTPFTSPNCVSLYNSGATSSANILLTTPQLSNLNAGTHQLRFYARAGSTSLTSVVVGTVSDPLNASTFTAFQTITGLTTAWKECVVDFSLYTGSDAFIAFRHPSNSTYTYLYIDDVNWEVLPSCFAPISPILTSKTLTTASFSWSEPTPVPSEGYEYEIRISGAAGSGNPGLETSGTVTTTSLSLSSLTANTNYSLYIRSNCGSGDFSAWTPALTFYTGYCTPAPTSVDGSGITKVEFSSVSNPTGSEPGNYGNYSAMIGDVQQTLTVPVFITFSTGYTYVTKIWIDWNNDLDFLDAGEEVYSGESLATNPTTLNASFIVPSSVSLGNHRMRIGGTDVGPPTPCYTGSYGSYEDYTVNVISAPACAPPSGLAVSNITSESAELSWTENGSATLWDVEWGIADFVPTGNPSNGFDNVNNNTNLSLAGLEAATEYEWYVRADCGGDNIDVSDWSGPYAFSTSCAIEPTPFTETVEGDLSCWFVSGGAENWAIASSSGYGIGSYSFIANFYGISSPTPFYLFSPEFDATTLANPVLEFDFAYAAYTGGEVDEMNIYYSTDGGATSSLLLAMPGGANGILNTAGTMSSSFVPTSGQWATRSVVLPAGTNMVIFGAISDWGNNLYIDNIEIKDATATAIWSGTANNKWYIATNWTPSVPGSETNVIIPDGLTNYPTLTALASCNNFTIQSGGSFIGSEFLTVNGTTTIERSITGYTSGTDGWHLISSPVANQTISGNWTPAGGYDFYALDESVSEYWLNQKNHPEMTNFIPGKGYLVAYETGETKSFTGAMNSAPLTMSGLTNSGGDYAGWHLVGNPFTSAINADLLTKTDIGTNVQVWNTNSASYEISSTIPALNGFMVEVETTGNGELTIPLTSRVHSNVSWFKSTEDQILLRANDPAGHTSQLSIVRFNPAATEAYDGAFDSHYLAGFAPMFYSKSAGEGFALNTLPLLTNETVIPFDFVKNGSSDFSIEMLQAVPCAIIYLTDKKTNTITNLLENPVYSFNAVEGDITDRFLLTFGSVGIGNPDVSDINIYGYQDVIFVNGAKAGSDVVVTNLLGQVMMSTTTTGDGVNTINGRNLADGIYLVSIISGNSVVSKKVVLQK